MFARPVDRHVDERDAEARIDADRVQRQHHADPADAPGARPGSPASRSSTGRGAAAEARNLSAHRGSRRPSFRCSTRGEQDPARGESRARRRARLAPTPGTGRKAPAVAPTRQKAIASIRCAARRLPPARGSPGHRSESAARGEPRPSRLRPGGPAGPCRGTSRSRSPRRSPGTRRRASSVWRQASARSGCTVAPTPNAIARSAQFGLVAAPSAPPAAWRATTTKPGDGRRRDRRPGGGICAARPQGITSCPSAPRLVEAHPRQGAT